MPKILRIINRFNLGGPTYNAAYLTKYLSPEFETMLIGGVKDDTEDSSEFIVRDLGIEPIIIPEMKRTIHPQNDWITYKKIRQIIKDFKPDIVHTHASKAGTLGRLAASRLKVPVIVHTFHGHVFHSYFSNIKTSLYKNIERYLAKKSTSIIAISEKQKEELAITYKICPADKIAVIPLGFDLSRFQENMEEKRLSFRKEFNIDDEEIAIGIVGRLVPVKNHELFIEALKYVKDKTSYKIRAFIVGDGEDRQKIELKAKKINIDFVDSVKTSNNKATLTFTSWVRNIDYVYAGMDIIALTSFNEGTPVSLIEAQAANKPIVSTNAGGVENVIIPNTTALLSDLPAETSAQAGNSNVFAFAENLLSLIENPKMRYDMGKEGWNHVKEKFHYTRLVNDVRKLYKKNLDERG